MRREPDAGVEPPQLPYVGRARFDGVERGDVADEDDGPVRVASSARQASSAPSPPRQISCASRRSGAPAGSRSRRLVAVAPQRSLEDVPRPASESAISARTRLLLQAEPVGHLGELEDATRLAVAGCDDERAALFAGTHIGVEDELQTG